MLRPTAEALARLPELRATGEVDLGAVNVLDPGAVPRSEGKAVRVVDRRSG